MLKKSLSAVFNLFNGHNKRSIALNGTLSTLCIGGMFTTIVVNAPIILAAASIVCGTGFAYWAIENSYQRDLQKAAAKKLITPKL